MQQKKQTNPDIGTADAAEKAKDLGIGIADVTEEAVKLRQRYSRHSSQTQIQQTQQKEWLNPGTGTANIEELDKLGISIVNKSQV